MTDADPEREIRTLHEFFVDYYAGERDEIDRLDAVLAPKFEMITPDGDVRGRDAVVEGIERSHGKHADADPPFDIGIEDVRVRESWADRWLCTYEEHQSGPEGETSRLSTVLFRAAPDAPHGVAWVHLHETWLDGE
jgi:hypothetical protein